MPEPGYLALALAVAVAITVSLRALPFLLKKPIEGSALLADLGRWLPLGAIGILAVYCVSRIDVAAAAHGVPQVAAIAATAAVHLWRRNAVLSIVTGTAVCVTLSLVL